MPDVVVTVPQSFGLDAWIAEGDLPGEPWSGETYGFDLGGPMPDIQPFERVYVVYKDKLRGYAPLIEVTWHGKIFGDPCRGRFALIRGGGAVAVTIPEPIRGFRGWRYRWWDRAVEVPFPNWMEADPCPA